MFRVLICLAVLLAFLAVSTQAQQAGGPGKVETPTVDEASLDTDEVVVFLVPGTDPKAFAQAHGLALRRTFRSDPDICVFSAGSVTAARAIQQDLAADPAAIEVHPNRRSLNRRMAFVPNDPYFPRGNPFQNTWDWGQWHLVNQHVSGRDARVQGAWNRDVTGAGVTIGICDDGLQTAHPDLAPNYVAADSWDFGQNDNNPNPVYSTDNHGISVAGIAAARGGNGIGVTGAAPHAGIAGLRLDFNSGTDQSFADATLYRSSGSNTSIKVKNHSYGVPDPFITTSLERSAFTTSANAGTIHCLAAGNERGTSGEDSNKKHIQSSPDVITVAAFGSNGTFASYSSYGACVFVSAPSNSYTSGAFPGTTTTDRMGESAGYNGSGDPMPDGDYTSRFGGTSSASPLVAGVMALVKQVQPALNVRFAKHLLARTCDVVDPGDATSTSDGGWKTNAAGFKFNQNYGFGLIDADELTILATQYTGVTARTTASTGTVTVSAAIPDNNPTGVTRNFSLSGTQPLEEVLVTLNITHPYRGDLVAYLTSPAGTTSRLFNVANDSGDNINWTFCTNAFWGESPTGTWSLRVADVVAADVGTWNSYNVTLRMGTLIPATLNPPTVTAHPAPQRVNPGANAMFSVTATGSPTLTYQWQRNGVNIANGIKYAGVTTHTLHVLNVQTTEVGSYRCVVTNAAGSATSRAALLTLNLAAGPPEMVESRPGGVNYHRYAEVGILDTSSAKSTAAGTTAGIGSRYGSMDRTASGIRKAVYSFTPTVSGFYEVFVTWPASTNAGTAVEHLIAHRDGTASVMLDQNSASNPAGANAWNTAGQYYLLAGNTATVTQTNENFPEVGTVFRADGVRWNLLIADTAPVLISAVSRRTHGGAGTFDIPVHTPGAVECRTAATIRIVAVFDQPVSRIDHTVDDVLTTAGTVTAVTAVGSEVTVDLVGVPAGQRVAIAFPGIAAYGNPALTSTSTLCFGALAGDVSADGTVNVVDLVSGRNVLDQPAAAGNFRCDVNADGLINTLDLVGIRNHLNLSLSGLCP